VLDEALISQIEDTLKKSVLEQYDVPGLAISIVKEGQIAYMKGFGVAEQGKEQPVTPELVFPWGYVAIPVTATAVMQLRAEGKVDLDAPVTKYLPYFQMADERYRQITPRQLLAHTSGLAAYKGGESEWGTTDGDNNALEQQVRSLASDKLENIPGKAWSASFVGFEILGDMIAKVSGETFEVYMRDHIFAPLGLSHTTYLLSEVDQKLLTMWHIRSRDGAISPTTVQTSRRHAPGMVLFSTVEDMAGLALMYLNHGSLGEVRILSADACDEMWKVQTHSPFSSGGVSWDGCLGWLCGNNPKGHRLLIMDGPYYSVLVLAPDGGVGIVLAMNYSATSFWPTLSPIMDKLLGDQ
jgi:CubicO group peptidase (beta-lactamase class C family)